MLTATDRPTGRPEDRQNSADDQQNDPERPEDRYVEHETQHKQYQTKDDHAKTSTIWALRQDAPSVRSRPPTRGPDAPPLSDRDNLHPMTRT